MDTPRDESTTFLASLCLAQLALTIAVPVGGGPLLFLYALLVVTCGHWLSMTLYATLPALATVVAIRRAMASRYRSTLAWTLIPACALLLGFTGTELGGFIRFRLHKASYDRVVADASAGKCGATERLRWQTAIDAIDCGNPVTIIFIWDGFVSSWGGIVYDAADQIIVPTPQRAAGWKNREIGSLLSCSGALRALGHHYFIAGGSYTHGPHDCG